MLTGLSNSKGILIQNTQLKEKNAIFGYYENNEIQLLIDHVDELKKLQESQENKQLNKHDNTTKLVIYIFILYLLILFISLFTTSLLHFISILIFCVLSYFPLLIILVTMINPYDNKESFHQFRKYHATEHALIYLLTKNITPTMENLQKAPIYSSECGTTLACTCFVLSLIISLLIKNCFSLGIIRVIIILLISIIVLFINFFNPFNPFFLIQSKVVESPTIREYELGLKLAEAINELKKETNS